MLTVFIISCLLFVLGVLIFLKFAVQGNSLKVIGIFIALVFGLISFYIFAKANAEGTYWVCLAKRVEIYNLQPFKNESYIKENSDYYFVLLEGSNEPLKIAKGNANIANSNDSYRNKVVKETILEVSTKADNDYSFLAKEGEIKYQVFYHIYID